MNSSRLTCFWAKLNSTTFSFYMYYIFWLACHPVFWVYKWIIYFLPTFLSALWRWLTIPPALQPEILIVGGGFGGFLLASKLQVHPDLRVSLVDKKGFFDYQPALVKLAVDPDHLKFMRIESSALNQVQAITGEMNYLGSKHISVRRKHAQGGKETTEEIHLPYHFLVLATGASYQMPKELNVEGVYAADVTAQVLSAYPRLLNSQHVLIIGGGITGVELALEIAEKFPSKTISLVHSGQRLFPDITESLGPSNYAMDVLLKHNVQVILGTRVLGVSGVEIFTNRVSSLTFQTSQNTQISADIAYFCACQVPNTQFNNNNKECIQVTNTLQFCNGGANLFAIGDVAQVEGTNEKNLAQIAEIQAELVAHNILAAMDGKNLSTYHSHERIVLISLGRLDAIFVWGGWSFTGIFPALLKEAVEWKTLCRYWFRTVNLGARRDKSNHVLSV